MATKITKRMVLEHLMETYANDTMVVDYAKHEIELLDKKASNKVPTKVQIENENIKNVIVEVLTNATSPMTITDITNANEKLVNLSNQKISALLTQLINANLVVRTSDKKKAYFSIVR
jgi:predicted transcriptional regulator